MTKPNKPPVYVNVQKTDKKPQRRLLNRGAIRNGLGGQKVEYPVNRVMPRNKNGKPANLIDVNLNNFLPKLPDANTGNTKMRGVNPYAPEPKPITDGTSYLDIYQMKPGFHFPDVEDKIKIAARHKLQIKVVPKEIVKLEDDLDNRPCTRMHREDHVSTERILSPSELSVISYNRNDSPLNIPMPPSRRASPLHAGPPTMPPSRRTSPLCAGPPTMPHGEGTHLSSSPEPHIKGALVPRPPPMSCGEGQEHAYMPRPPSMSRNEERMHMPRPPPGPRGVRHAFMPQPPTVQREDQPHMPTVPKEDGPFYYKRKTTVKLEQMDIFPHPNTQLGLGPEVLNYMPTPPSVTQRCGSERNIRGESQQKGGDRKTLPPLQRKRPY